MKLITSLLVFCFIFCAGSALAQTDMNGNMDNMSRMNNCTISGIMSLMPETAGTMTGTDNMTDQTGGNMTGIDNMTGVKKYITATVKCMPAMGNMTGGTQAGNMTGETETSNMTSMENMTGTKTCYIAGIATPMIANMTGAQTGNITGDQTYMGSQAAGNMTAGNTNRSKTYEINATVICMPEALNNMTGGAQTGNMTEGAQAGSMTSTDNMTGAKIYNITGIMTLTPIEMAGSQAAGNMTGAGNTTGSPTYNITAIVACMPVAGNMTGGTQAGNMTGGTEAGNMTGTDNMTGAKTCYITGTATPITADMTGAQAGNMTADQTNMGSQAAGNMTKMGSTNGAQTYAITATVSCMKGNQTESMAVNQTGM